MPHYAVIFVSRHRSDLTPPQLADYERAGKRMLELARAQPGFLRVESVRDEQGNGITVSYWESLEAIAQWKQHAEHREAQEKGRHAWYGGYDVQVCRVEREYSSATARVTS